MKKIAIGIFVFILVSSIQAEDIRIKSEIKSVTVFLQGAQISRNAEVQMAAGIQTYVFEKLPVALDESSIQIKTPKTLKVLSVNYQINSNQKKDEDSQIEILKNKIKTKDLEIKKLKSQLEVYNQEEAILLKNSEFSGKESGVNLDELKQAADYFRSRLTELALKKLEIENTKDNLQTTIYETRAKLAEIQNTKPEPTAEVIVSVQASSTGNYKLSLNYFIRAAGWIPAYDIRVEDVGKPLTMSVKARVYQNTGEDWNMVNLVLSTDNPQKSNSKPFLSTWYLNYGQPYRPLSYSTPTGEAAVKGRIMDSQTGEPIPFANVVLERGGQMIGGGTSDYDGNYLVNNIPPGYYDMKVSYIGYNTSITKGVVVNPNRMTFNDVGMEASAQQLEEVVVSSYSVPLIDKDKTVSGGYVTAEEIQKMPNRNANSVATTIGGVYSADGDKSNIRGSRINQTDMYIDGVRVTGSNEYIPQQQVKTPTNIRYEVSVPYTIPSDGEKYVVRIIDHSIPTEYEYYCAPKIDEDVYLIAQLTDWSALNLLSGESSIYFEGTYMGKSFLDVRNTDDTLTISVGRDNSVVVVRKQNKEYKASQILGTNVKATRAYTITVRNNRKLPVTLLVEDQIPVSNLKEISVDLNESSDAEFDEDTGKLSWKMDLQKGENKEFGFNYSVKYPKGKMLYLD